MDQALKKKLQTFLNDMLKFGTVKGFKYFSMYLRGREEMMVNILNEPQNLGSHPTSDPTSPCVMSSEVNPSHSFTSHNLPYEKGSLLMSQTSQMALSGFGGQGVGLPPASPSDDEPSQDLNSTVFLVAGYAKYSCPYVWVRSNHQRLVRLTGEGGERDSPLKLKCSAKWKDTDVRIWDVISELIKLCTYPVPRNPFEVDVEYIDSLPLKERVFVTGSLANSLQKIMLHTKDEKHYSGKVFDDLHFVTKKHFEGLQDMVRQKQIPGVENILQEERKQQQQQFREAQTHARTTQRKRYPSQTYTEQANVAYGLKPMYGGPAVTSSHPNDPFAQHNQYQGHSNVGFGYGQTPSMF